MLGESFQIDVKIFEYLKYINIVLALFVITMHEMIRLTLKIVLQAIIRLNY